MEKCTGSSNGCFREVDIFDTYVVKRPKKNYTDGGPEIYIFERTKEEKCFSCPFKHLCDDLSYGNYTNEDFLSKYDELEQNCPECELFSYYEDFNEDYIDEEECSRCNIVEFDTWEQLEGHRGGLCDIFSYDEFSEELIMKKARIAGDIFDFNEIYSKSHAIMLPREYNRKTCKYEHNKIIYKQNNKRKKTRTTKKQKKQIEKFRRLLNKHPELTEFKDIIIFAIVTDLNYKPLIDTIVYAAKKRIYFNDMHSQNWGLIGKRIVIIDYARA